MCLTDGFSVTFSGRWRGAVRIHVSHMQLTCVTCSSHVANYYMVEGSPHVCHVWQLTCMLLLYGGGEPSRVSRVAINVHVTTIWWRGALTCGSRVSCVAHVAINVHVTTIWWRGALTCGSRVSCVAHVAINVHITTIWWRGALTCGSHVSHVAHVAINVHITTIWWRGALTCGSHVSCVSRVEINVYVTTIWWKGPSHVAHVCHVWQLTCTLLLYGGGEPSCVAHVHGN